MTAVDAHGPKPALEWVPIGKLSVDAKYQRDTGSRRSRNLIDKIVAGFKWSRFGVVMAVRHDGGFHVIDGQHRVESARALKVATVPVLILPHATIAEAAADFVAINRDRVAVTPLHIHHAQLAAGDAEAEAIARVCARANVEICRYPVPANKLKPGQTLAVQSIARLIKLKGPEFAERVLKKVRDARGGDAPGAMNAVAIRRAAADLWTAPSTMQGSARHADNAPRPKPQSAPQQRRCLGCDSIFRSEGSHNRLCPACRARA